MGTSDNFLQNVGILGGERDLRAVTAISGTTSVTIAMNIADFSLGGFPGSGGIIVYDGVDGLGTIDTVGLGSLDLTAGGDDRFLLNFQNSNCDTFIIEVYSGSDQSSLTLNPFLNLGNIELEYTSFVGTADFSQVGAIRIIVLGNNTPCAVELFDFRTSTSQQDEQVIGGEIIPIETTSLLLSSTQTFSWMIPVLLSGLGIGLFVVSKDRKFHT